MFSKGFPEDKLITYSGMLWLLAAQIIVMLPFLFYLPIWLFPILFFSAGWRISVMLGKASQPGNIIKFILAALGMVALKMSGLSTVSLDMTASLLTLGFAYKSLEVIQRRDGMVVILTGFILLAVIFLYSQTISITLYSLVATGILTAAMIAIQKNNPRARSKLGNIFVNLRLSSSMLFLCLPLMLLFFFFSPRFQPFWNIPAPGSHAKTGITDSMSPGDIANLSQSDELAFIVNFEGERPPQNQLYWRGLVLQYFDGVTWTQNDPELPPEMLDKRNSYSLKTLKTPIIKQGDPIKYRAIYQQTGQPWMFTLTPVVDINGAGLFTSDFRIIAKTDIIDPLFVKFTSYPDSIKEPELDDTTRELNLQLPENGNIKSRLLAEQLLATSGTKEEYIQRVLNRFREQQYFYTLRPPLLGDTDTIDGFLIDSRKGFCAHYAGSFVFMMRSAGIPARVVAGYQGGSWNDKGKFLSVHQFDAHAWTEIWLEGKGWQRLDPTAMVAPERIEQNLEAAIKEEGSFLEGQVLSLNKMKWLNGLRLQLENLQYEWQNFVLNFDSDAQQNFLQRLFGKMSISKTMMIMCGFLIGIILLWVGFLGLARKRNIEAPEHQLYRHFCDILAKKGVIRDISQTPEDYAQTAAINLPENASLIKEFTQNYNTLCYSPRVADQATLYLNRMKLLLKKLK